MEVYIRGQHTLVFCMRLQWKLYPAMWSSDTEMFAYMFSKREKNSSYRIKTDHIMVWTYTINKPNLSHEP